LILRLNIPIGKCFRHGLLTSTLAWAQDPIQIHGFIQGRFTNQEGTQDRLEIRRARIAIFGDLFSQLSYNTQMDVLKKPYLLDAALTWKPRSAFHFTAGQLKIPFSTESLAADNLTTPIERARAVNILTPGRDTGVQARDAGLQVSGTFEHGKQPLADYAVGIFRGQTFVKSPAAHFRGTSARVLVHPLAGLVIGADWYGSLSVSGGPVKRRHEAEGSYRRKALTLQVEQIWARDGQLERRGGYALSAWRFNGHWEGMTRPEWLSSDTSEPNAGSFVYEAGANYYYGEHIKLQANVGARNDQLPARTTAVSLFQIQLSF
ncbi:MAG: porin, partial [Acidobacteriota bacterium]